MDINLPIIASQISLCIGIGLVANIIVRKREQVRGLDFKTDAHGENIKGFILMLWSKMLPFVAHYRAIVRKGYYNLAQRFLHILRLWALKLETFSTKRLHQVKTIKTESMVQKMPVAPQEEKKVPILDGIFNGNGNYFSLLKEDSQNDKIQDKLEDLKSSSQVLK